MLESEREKKLTDSQIFQIKFEKMFSDIINIVKPKESSLSLSHFIYKEEAGKPRPSWAGMRATFSHQRKFLSKFCITSR
jgi:hypothetical protein